MLEIIKEKINDMDSTEFIGLMAIVFTTIIICLLICGVTISSVFEQLSLAIKAFAG